MCCGGKKDDLANWIKAASTGNLTVINKQLSKMKGKRDTRATNTDGNIFNSFTAMHYACYFNHLQVVQKLFDFEYMIKTGDAVRVKSKFSSADVEMNLGKDSTPLMIAIARGSIPVAKFLLEKASTSGGAVSQQILGVSNASGLTALGMACSSANKEMIDLILLKDAVLLKTELHMTAVTGTNAIHHLALFARTEVFDKLTKYIFDSAETSPENKKLRIQFVEKLMSKDSNQNSVFDMVYQKTIGRKFGVSDDHKDAMYKSLKTMVRRVYIWALQLKHNELEIANGFLGAPYEEICKEVSHEVSKEFLERCTKASTDPETDDTLYLMQQLIDKYSTSATAKTAEPSQAVLESSQISRKSTKSVVEKPVSTTASVVESTRASQVLDEGSKAITGQASSGDYENILVDSTEIPSHTPQMTGLNETAQPTDVIEDSLVIDPAMLPPSLA